MAFVSLLLFFQRTFTRVLDFQCRGDNQDFAQTVFLVRRPDDAGDAGIDGKPSQFPPHVGQRMLFRHSPQFKQCFVAILDGIRLGGFEERKIFNVPQPERFRLENDVGEIRSQDFRWRIAFTRLVIFLRIQTDTDPRTDATAATSTLIGRGLRHRLNRQPLKLGFRRITTDARGSRINDVTNPRDRQ